MSGLEVQVLQGVEGGVSGQKPVAEPPEKAPILPPLPAIPNGAWDGLMSSRRQAWRISVDVVCPVVEVQSLRFASLEQGDTKGMYHVGGVVLIEKLAMGNHPAGIINEGDQKCLFAMSHPVAGWPGRTSYRLATTRWRIAWKRSAATFPAHPGLTGHAGWRSVKLVGEL